MKVKNSIVIRIIAKLIFFLCCSHIPFKYFLSVVDHVEGGGGVLMQWKYEISRPIFTNNLPFHFLAAHSANIGVRCRIAENKFSLFLE